MVIKNREVAINSTLKMRKMKFGITAISLSGLFVSNAGF